MAGLPQEEGIHRESAHGKISRNTVKKAIGQLISEAIGRQAHAMGEAMLASYFDGREGKEVAVSTVSRWKTDPDRFPGVFVGVLAELDSQFRSALLQTLMASELVPERVLAQLPADKADEYRKLIERRFEDAAFGPGRQGEHYA